MQRLQQWLKEAPFALVAAAWAHLLALALTFPAGLRLGREVLGSPDSDTMKHLWTLWWIRTELLSGNFPFQTELVNYPVGMELYPIEPLNGLVAAMLPFLGIEAANNVIAILNLTATGLCGALLGKEISGNRWGGLAAGTLLQGSAIATFTIHVGVGELQHLWWLPLGMLAWLRLRQGMRWQAALALGGSLAGASLSCFYHGFFLATGVAVLSLVTLWAGAKTLRLLGLYALAAGLGALVVVPVMKTFATSYGTDEPSSLSLSQAVFQEHGQPVTDPSSARLELPHLVVPRWGEWEDASRQDRGYAGGRYLGWIALALALVALIRDPKRAAPWAAVTVLALLLSLGSMLVLGGEEVTVSSGQRLRLPFLYLNRLLGHVGEGLNFPVRFVALSTTAIAALAAIAAGRVRQPWIIAALALASVLEVRANQLTPLRHESFELLDYEGLEQHADGEHPTLDLGLALRPDAESRTAALTAQMITGQPLHAVPLERIEFFAPEGARFASSLPMMEDLSALYLYQRGEPPEDLRPSLCLLEERGIRRVQLLGARGSQILSPYVVAGLTAHLGEPLISTPLVALWDIPPQECPEEDMVRWREDLELALDMRPAEALGPIQQDD